MSCNKEIFEQNIIIRNQRGLHARAAAKFVRLVETFNADVQVARNGQQVSGRSIMGLMMLAANEGSEISLHISGRDAQKALNAVCALINAKFGEAS